MRTKFVAWYERERMPYKADTDRILKTTAWLKSLPWQLFCTLTFAYQVSLQQANALFDQFIDRSENSIRAPLTYVRGTENRYSGCGLPGSPWHFHLVIGADVALDPERLGRLWESMAGRRTSGAGADMRPYDRRLEGLAYVLKFGEWDFRNLHLAFGARPTTARARRRQRRQQIRISKTDSGARADFTWPTLAYPLEGGTPTVQRNERAGVET
jgi:hypothetical protein